MPNISMNKDAHKLAPVMLAVRQQLSKENYEEEMWSLRGDSGKRCDSLSQVRPWSI